MLPGYLLNARCLEHVKHYFRGNWNISHTFTPRAACVHCMHRGQALPPAPRWAPGLNLERFWQRKFPWEHKSPAPSPPCISELGLWKSKFPRAGSSRAGGIIAAQHSPSKQPLNPSQMNISVNTQNIPVWEYLLSFTTRSSHLCQRSQKASKVWGIMMEWRPRRCPNKWPQRLDYGLLLLITGFSLLSLRHLDKAGWLIN